MLRTVNLLITLTFFSILPLFASTARCEPIRAVFYPDSADLTEQLELTPTKINGRTALVFDLPAEADTNTLELELPVSLAVADLKWDTMPNVFRGKGLTLFNELEKMKTELVALQSRRQALEAQVGFWTGQTPFKTMTVAEAGKMAEAIGTNIRTAGVEKYDLDKQITALTTKIKLQEQKLTDAAGRERAMRRVTAFVSGKAVGAVQVKISYLLRGAGWKPLCRFDALPEKNSVHFSYEAELWQNSGLDFTKADLTLATLRRTSRTEPPHLRPWVIRPRPEMVAMAEDTLAAPRAAKMMVADNGAGMVMTEAAPPTPQYQAGTTFGMWELRKRNVPAGEPIRFEISRADWDADFSWLLRPSVSKNSFLRAEIKLKDDPDLPPAEGLFLVNGDLLVTQNIHLSGKEQTLFFGSDSSVRAREKLVDRKSGESGLLSSKQTFMWKYEITVENDKKRSVPVRLEEPRPVVRDERIEIKVDAPDQPKIDPKDDVWFWTMDLAAENKKIITYQVDVTAPEDIKLSTGR